MDEVDNSSWSWPGLLVPTVTFLVGLVLGGVLVYANGGGDASEVVAPESDTTASLSGAEDDTVVTLPAACDQAATKVREAYDLLRQAVGQVQELQADALVDTLNSLEDVDAEARVLVTECSAVQVSTSPTASSDATSSPSTSPTESSTE